MKNTLRFGFIAVLLHALPGQASLTATNIALGCEATHSLFLQSDGSLWGMGYNAFGQLGNGAYFTNSPYGTNRPGQTAASDVTALAAGYGHSLFLKSDGSLWAMGYNNAGQLGDGTFNSTNWPEQIVAGGVTAVAAGYDDSLFLKSDGSLWAMGANNEGQLGDGTFNKTNQPEQIVASGVTAIATGGNNSPVGTGGGTGGGQSLFLKSDGSLWAMGNNKFGQLGDGTFSKTNWPEQIVASGVIAIAAGSNHSLFLKSDGSLWAMGNNSYGQLGDGTFNKTNRPEQIVASGVIAIAAGGSHSLFLKSDGSLWAMGNNIYGQLGDGIHVYPYYTNQPEQIVAGGVTAIAAGTLHSLFLKSDGSLWVMGYNDYGQLGDGFIDNYPRYGTATPEPIFPAPSPVLNSTLSSVTDLQFKATCGFGGNFRLLGSTNITLPLSQWASLQTNSISLRGTNNYSVTLINAVTTAGQQFYILQSP